MAVGKGWVVVRLGDSSAAKIASFIALHKLFGEARQRSMMDLLAERVVQLGGTAEGTIQVAAKLTELKIYPLHISGERTISTQSALAAYGKNARCAIGQTDELATRTPPISSQRSRSVWTSISGSSRHIG